MKPLLMAALAATLTGCCGVVVAGISGCAARPAFADDDRDPAAVARSADLEASPLTKPVLPPLVVPPYRVSAVGEQTVPGWPALAVVARRPNARTLQRVIDEAVADLLADRAVRDGAGGPVVLVYRDRTTSLDRPFDLEVGLVVRPDVKPTAKGVAVRALPPLRALAVSFDGPVTAIDKAYDHLLPEVQASPLRPTGEVREVYARWPGVGAGTAEDGGAAGDSGTPGSDVLIAVGVEEGESPSAAVTRPGA